MATEAKLWITAGDRTKSAFRSVNRSLTALNKNVGLVAGGMALLAGAGASRAFIRQEQALFQLNARLRSTGGVAGRTAEDIQRMASELQSVTTIGDEARTALQSRVNESASSLVKVGAPDRRTPPR